MFWKDLGFDTGKKEGNFIQLVTWLEMKGLRKLKKLHWKESTLVDLTESPALQITMLKPNTLKSSGGHYLVNFWEMLIQVAF